MSTGTQVEVVMPQMGVSVSEGTVTKWLKQQGETVALDEPLLEISTDKVDTEVPSPGEGVVLQILVPEGTTVDVGTVLAVIAPAGAAAPAANGPQAPTQEPAAPAEAEAPVVAQQPPEPAPAPEPTPPTPAQPMEAPVAPQAAAAVQGDGRTFVSPVVARIAAEHGVDPNAVAGTGQGGRVTKKDILAFIESAASMSTGASALPAAAEPEPAVTAPPPPAVAEPEPAVAAPPPPAAAEPEPVVVAPTAPVPAPAPPPTPVAPLAPQPAVTAALPATSPQPQAADLGADLGPGESAEPITAMRRGVMEHMRRSLDTSAHVTSAIEVDMSRVVAIREKLKREYQASVGVNPTYLAFVARATVETLKDYPLVNAQIRGEKIVTRQYVNLGIAVSLDEGRGLIVPVIRNAQDLNLLGVARAITDLAERARTKKLLPDDVQGGTFTITNPGGYGTFHGTPIINQPQAAILGTYALVKRPWVVQDELGQDVIAIRPMMNLTLTYDHRLVDGAYAGAFLRDLRERLETLEEGEL